MRKTCPWIALIPAGFAAALIVSLLPGDQRRQPPADDAESFLNERHASLAAEIASPASGLSPSPPTGATIGEGNGAIQEMRAYRLTYDQGRVTLQTVEDIRGDFRPRRRPPSRQAGMICCQLLDSFKTVIGEETLPVPGQSCVVLDPNSPASGGEPQAVAYSPPGPHIFQLRLPKHMDATELRITLLAQDTDPAPASLSGQVLAAIPLAK